MVKKEELFSSRCDECGKSKMSLKVRSGLYVCISCFVKRSNHPEPGQEIPVIYISVSGGVISVDRKSKGVMLVIREHDEEQEPGAPKPYLITYPEDSEVKLTYDFFRP